MNHLPSMQTLRAFEAAYRRENYSRAAEELGLTHGAVSHRIRELEQRLGARLFERRLNRMVPTEDARRLLARIRPALRILEEAFGTAAPPRRHALTLSVLPAFASRWLIPRLDRLRAAHPDLELNIRAESELLEAGDGRADAAVRFGGGTWVGLEAEMLAGETIFPVCAPAYRTRLSIETPADLDRCRLLRHAWQQWETWLDEAGVALEAPPSGPLFEDSDLLLKAAEAGEGVALARRLLVGTDLEAGRLVRLFEVEAVDAYSYYFVRDPARVHPKAEQLKAWLKAEMAESRVDDRSEG